MTRDPNIPPGFPDPPERRDGVDAWARQHIKAARLRADEMPWVEVAAELRIREASARNYANIGGFAELVDYYETVAAAKRYQAIENEAVELVAAGKLASLASMVEAAAKGDWKAGAKFLEVIGFADKNRKLGELDALHEAGQLAEELGQADRRSITVARKSLTDEPNE